MTSLPSVPGQITLAGLTSATAEIAAVQAAVDAVELALGDYGAGAESDVAAGLIAQETLVGAYSGGDETTVGAGLKTAESRLDGIDTDLASAQCVIDLPLGGWRLATGAAIPAFSSGAADGFDPTSAEAMPIRWNDDSTTAIRTTVNLPPDLDRTADVVLHLRGCRVGAADETAALTAAVYAATNAAAYTASNDAGSDSTAFDGATTVVTEEIVTIGHASLPASNNASLMISLVPTAALDDDDLCLFGAWLTYTRAKRTS